MENQEVLLRVCNLYSLRNKPCTTGHPRPTESSGRAGGLLGLATSLITMMYISFYFTMRNKRSNGQRIWFDYEWELLLIKKQLLKNPDVIIGSSLSLLTIL